MTSAGLTDDQLRTRASQWALNVQHRTALVKGVRLCSKFPRSDGPYSNGDVPIRVRLSSRATGVKSRAAFGNLARCDNVWSCSLCSPSKALARRHQVDRAIDSWLEQGFGLQLLTLTVPHRAEDTLESLFRLKSRAWASVRSSRSFRSMRASGDLAGFINVTQVTHRSTSSGGVRGWHVHVHCLLFTSRPLGSERTGELERELSGAWKSRLSNSGVTFRGPTPRSSDLREVTTNRGLGHYLTTKEGYAYGYGRPLDMAPDLDVSPEDKRMKGSVVPHALFEQFAESDPVSRGQFIAWKAGTSPLFADNQVGFVDARTAHFEPVPIRREHRAWFEFQLSASGKRKTSFSRVTRAGGAAAQYWNELVSTGFAFDDAVEDGSGLQGRDRYIVSGESWRRVLASSYQARAMLLSAAELGDGYVARVATSLGLEITTVAT